MRKMSKRQAVKVLYDSDHAFLKPEVGSRLCEAFDVPIMGPMIVKADYKNPKGLTGPGLSHGQKVHGYDAAVLADYIASKLDAKFSNPCLGRGSSLRFATAFIEKKVGLKTAPVNG